MAKKSEHRLTRSDQKKLAHLASRPDIPKAMALRLRWLDWVESNFDWLMERQKVLLETATKDTEPQARLIMNVISRFVPELRENTQGPEAAAGTSVKPVSIKVYNVNRGTVAARKDAIEMEKVKRAQYAVPNAE